MKPGPAEPNASTPLERQQMLVADPRQQTFWHRVRFELTTSLALRHRSAALLDLGAGSGLLGDYVVEHAPTLDYRFEELSPLLDDLLTERFGSTRRSEPTSAIGADTTVAMLDVLEHIDDDLAALVELRGRMAPDTQLIVTVPALQWAFSGWDEALGHHRRYSRRSLRQVLERAGFAVDAVNYLFPELLPLLPIRKIRTAPRDHVDFPQLGRGANAIGHVVSTATTRLRRIWPAGTSVIAIAHRAGTS
jgi:hypothetical protein